MSDDGWSRRDFGKGAMALGAASLLGCPEPDPTPADPPPVPPPQGVILITADDLGWRDLAAYGLTAIATPALDALVADSVGFSRAFDVVSTCSSSRATYATGQYPHTHGVTGLVHRHPELSLPPTHPTFMRTLQDAGWATAIQGKWHLSDVERPEAFGFDTYLPTNIDQVIDTSNDAIWWLQDHRDSRFYLELNYMQPHRDVFGEYPQQPGFEVDEAVAAPPEWWGLPDWPEIRAEVAGYLSRLRWMDALIGEVLGALDGAGLAEDTLVVFVSDNGPAFPGCKTTLYDRGVGTPLLFRWPAGLTAGERDELVSSVDLAPTILDLLGIDGLPDAQGRSLAPTLRGDPDWTPATALFSEHERHAGGEKPTRAVRTERFKYIRNLNDVPWGDGGGNGAWKEVLALEPDQTWDEPRPPEELFDLEVDPLERVNLATDPAFAGLLDAMRGRLADWMAATDDVRLPEL